MTDKAKLRKEQLAYIDQILMHTGLDLTGIAKASKLASTTLTRFYNNQDHKFCLSATTLAKITEKFSYVEQKEKSSLPAVNANDNRADSELAITFVLELILKTMLDKKHINSKWLEENLLMAHSHYRKNLLPNAALLIAELMASVSQESQQKETGPSRQSFGLAPLSLR